ncbi:MAG: hypothetical protein ABSF81_12505 [Bacteroidales bacterium]
MKRLMFLFVMFVLISFSSFGQAIFPIDEKGEIVYSGVVNVDSINSKELYVRAHEWFANTFNRLKMSFNWMIKKQGK